jgi:hypothetical protein
MRERPLNLPQSMSRLYPPIMIAGDGELKTLRLVARYANACDLPGPEVPKNSTWSLYIRVYVFVFSPCVARIHMGASEPW